MSEHGFLRPNPALLDLEARIRRKPTLAHDLGAGAKCTACGDKCPGFQLHYWRKVCMNCRCGKAEHNVQDVTDPGFYFVGKLFERPLRSREEELEFCYGPNSSDTDDSTEPRTKTVKFDWIPPNISKALAERYLRQLPSSQLPIAGSAGAQLRKQQLERQFPVHDIEPAKCHELSPAEVQGMREYINTVKSHVAGQAEVTEVAEVAEEEDDGLLFPPPPSEDELLGHMAGLAVAKKPPATLPKPGTKYLSAAKPYHAPNSLDSSRNNSPSPTSSTEDPAEPSRLKRPGQFNKASLGRKSGAGALTPSAAPSGPSARSECVGCLRPLQPGEVAVRADRAGPNKLWHPQCFRCSTCQELLVDLLYYYESGEVYCARDYAAKAKIPRCGACDELIFAPEYTGAEDKVWHLKHFCCFQCDRPLAGHKYIPIKGQPHCLMCYQNKEGKICTTCGEYIDPAAQRVSLANDHWHSSDECFKCGVCATPLLGKKMARKYGMILCSSSCARRANPDEQAHHAQISPRTTLV